MRQIESQSPINASEGEEMGTQILLVPGNQMMSEAVSAMRESAGHRIRMETSGADALEAFSRNPRAFDLVITDMGLPDISGLLLADKLFKMRPDIPVVLLTGEEGQAQSKARNSGIGYFCTKPLSMADLARTVEKALAGAE